MVIIVVMLIIIAVIITPSVIIIIINIIIIIIITIRLNICTILPMVRLSFRVENWDELYILYQIDAMITIICVVLTGGLYVDRLCLHTKGIAGYYSHTNLLVSILVSQKQ